MTDVFAYLNDLPAGAVKDEILNLVRTEGVVASVRAAIDVLGDSKAPAAARATMATLVFRLAGYLDKPSETDDPDGFATMSNAERKDFMEKASAEIASLERERANRRLRMAQIDEGVDIFA